VGEIERYLKGLIACMLLIEGAGGTGDRAHHDPTFAVVVALGGILKQVGRASTPGHPA
jgi:hypothetical protein